MHQTSPSSQPTQNHYSATSFPAQQNSHATPAPVVPSSSTELPRQQVSFTSDPRAVSQLSSTLGQAIPPFLNRSSSILQDSHPFSTSLDSNRRHSLPSQIATNDTPINLAPRRQTLAPSFTFNIPRVEVKEPETRTEPVQFPPSALGSSEHESRLSQKTASVPSTSTNSSQTLDNQRPSLPSTVSRNPQRLLTPQDPIELERFHSPSVPVASTSTSKLAPNSLVVPSSEPRNLVQASSSSSLPLSPPVSPEISRGDSIPFSSSAVSSSQLKSKEQTSTATESVGEGNRVDSSTSGGTCALSVAGGVGLGIMLEEVNGGGGGGNEVSRGIKRELMETNLRFGMQEETDTGVMRTSSSSAKRRKVEFVEMGEAEGEKEKNSKEKTE